MQLARERRRPQRTTRSTTMPLEDVSNRDEGFHFLEDVRAFKEYSITKIKGEPLTVVVYCRGALYGCLSGGVPILIKN